MLPVTCHMSLLPTATATDPPPAISTTFFGALCKIFDRFSPAKNDGINNSAVYKGFIHLQRLTQLSMFFLCLPIAQIFKCALDLLCKLI